MRVRYFIRSRRLARLVAGPHVAIGFRELTHEEAQEYVKKSQRSPVPKCLRCDALYFVDDSGIGGFMPSCNCWKEGVDETRPEERTPSDSSRAEGATTQTGDRQEADTQAEGTTQEQAGPTEEGT